MRKIDNLLFQKAQLEAKVADLQVQIQSIEERVTLLRKKEEILTGTSTSSTSEVS